MAAKRERARADREKREAEAALQEVQQYEPPGDDGGGLGDLQSEINEAKEELNWRLRPMVRHCGPAHLLTSALVHRS